MTIKQVSIKDLVAADYNPRKDLTKEDEAYRKLEQSIDEFGYVLPIIWNERTGRVVGGHQRLKVLKDKGEEAVTVVAVNIGEAEEKGLNVALNKVKGEWDYEKLDTLLRELDDKDLLEATGFSVSDISVQEWNNIEDLLKDGFGGAGEKEDESETRDEHAITFAVSPQDAPDVREYIEKNEDAKEMIKAEILAEVGRAECRT